MITSKIRIFPGPRQKTFPIRIVRIFRGEKFQSLF